MITATRLPQRERFAVINEIEKLHQEVSSALASLPIAPGLVESLQNQLKINLHAKLFGTMPALENLALSTEKLTFAKKWELAKKTISQFGMAKGLLPHQGIASGIGGRLTLAVLLILFFLLPQDSLLAREATLAEWTFNPEPCANLCGVFLCLFVGAVLQAVFNACFKPRGRGSVIIVGTQRRSSRSSCPCC